MLALIPTRAWLQLAAAAAIIGAGWWAYSWAYDKGADSVQVLWNAEKQSIADQTAALKADADKTSADLRTKTDTLRRNKDAQINRLNADLASALDGLRDRPARPGAGSVPGDTATGAGCTGASLYASDAGFLVRETARADRLRLDLQQCQAAYITAREALK